MKAATNVRTHINVYLLGSSAEFRMAERKALAIGELKIVGEDDHLDHGQQQVTQTAPDVVVLDGEAVPGNAMDLARHVRSIKSAGSRVVVLGDVSKHRSPDTMRVYAAAAMTAGASGYLLQDRALLRLASAVQQAALGRAVVDMRISRLLFNAYANDKPAKQVDPELMRRVALLSRREREVMRAVVAGKSNLEIAEELYLTVPTVKSHVSAILRTLQLRDRVQIAIAGFNLGWVYS